MATLALYSRCCTPPPHANMAPKSPHFERFKIRFSRLDNISLIKNSNVKISTHLSGNQVHVECALIINRGTKRMIRATANLGIQRSTQAVLDGSSKTVKCKHILAKQASARSPRLWLVARQTSIEVL